MLGLQLAAGSMKISMVTLDHFPRLTGIRTPVAPWETDVDTSL